jgi:anthranilate phosphoribosyltransferase
MSIATYLKDIGRGNAGARSLGPEAAEDLMAAVLDGRASELEIGAFAIAMRMKGETADELLGFLAAAHARCLRLPAERPVVILPSYNGARRLPNLTPLLAMRLAQEGVDVLVHGPTRDAKRVTTFEVFRDLGLPAVRCESELRSAWARREPAFMPIELLCPPLARLLAVRDVIGLRNSGHTIAKILDPVTGARALRVANHTHPEFGELLAALAARSNADLVLMRGTEGEPVADPRRMPRMEVYVGGQAQAELSVPAHEGVLAELPLLPRTCDAATTALYIQAVMSGEKPAPAPLERQVQLLVDTLAAMARPQAARSA